MVADEGREAHIDLLKHEQKKPEVKARTLEPDETCCVCCDNMKESDDLVHCKYGCGRLTHYECLMRCFKHNKGSGKPP